MKSHSQNQTHTHTHTPPTWGHHTLGFPTQTCQAELPHQTKIDPVRSLQHLQNTKWKSCLQSHLSHLFTTTNPELHWRPCPFHYLFFSLPSFSQLKHQNPHMKSCPTCPVPPWHLHSLHLRIGISCFISLLPSAKTYWFNRLCCHTLMASPVYVYLIVSTISCQLLFFNIF